MHLADIDHVLTTTRTVRKRLDLTRPVPLEVIQQCIEIATQAPTGCNIAWYHFVVVVDPAKRAALADIYRKAYVAGPKKLTELSKDYYTQDQPRLADSSAYLLERLHEVPVHIIPCVEGRVEHKEVFLQATQYGCIFPAAWSLMLALRARGLGAAWTTIHLIREKEVAALLSIPDHITQAALLPVAYFTGTDFMPAKRTPGRERTYWDNWGQTR